MLGVLHTWSRTLIFHPHIHYLIPGGGLSPDGRQWMPARPNFLLPVKALGAHFRTLFKTRLHKEHPDLFAQVPAKVWKRHWNVDCRPAGSGQNALRYLSRYVFKTATVQSESSDSCRRASCGGLIGKAKRASSPPSSWTRWSSWAASCNTSCRPSFARVRTFGWLHPAAKVRANRVRALLRQQPLLTPAEEQTWHQLAEPKPQAQTPSAEPVSKPEVACAPFCVRCQKAMRLIGSWKPGQPVPIPKRPKRPP